MYALIHNSQLILGPMGYNYRLINSELEDLEIDYKVSPRDYENVPIAIDVATKTYLFPATIIIPDHDSRFQSVGSFQWNIIEENDVPVGVEFIYPISDKTLDQIKADYKTQLSPIRRGKENTIIEIDLNGTLITISTSREERLSLASKLSASPGPHNFKFNNDVWMQITSTELEYIISQIDVKVQEAFDWEYSKVQEIDACSTGEEVYSVVLVEPDPEIYGIPTDN